MVNKIGIMLFAIFSVSLLGANASFADSNDEGSTTSKINKGGVPILIAAADQHQRTLMKKKLRSTDPLVRQKFGSAGSSQTMDGNDEGKVCSISGQTKKTETQCRDGVMDGVDVTICCPFECTYRCVSQGPSSGSSRPIGALNPGKLSGRCEQKGTTCTVTPKTSGLMAPPQTQGVN